MPFSVIVVGAFCRDFLSFGPGRLAHFQLNQRFTNQRSIMSMVAEREMEHIGKTKGAENHDHDMIHELSKRLDALWRYDQYIANAEDDSHLQEFWRELKEQEQENVIRLKQFVAEHIEKDCF
jgi:hypothetical protein